MDNRISRRTLVVASAVAVTTTHRMTSSVFASNRVPLPIPESPLGRQIAWALSLFTGNATGLTEAIVKTHFDPSMLAQLSAPALIASLDRASAQLGPITAVAFIQAPSETSAVIEIEANSGDRFAITIVTTGGPADLISILTFRPLSAGATPMASPAASIDVPDTAAGRQLTWLLGLLSGAPVSLSAGDLAQHFSAQFIPAVGAAALNASLLQLSVGYGPFTLESFVNPPSESSAVAIITDEKDARFKVAITVAANPPNVIEGLLIDAAASTEAAPSWDAFNAEWKGFAASSAFYVVELTAAGALVIAGSDETNPFAIGSTFKLYVLGALALEIEAGQMTWDDKLAIRDDWKSLPSGEFQNQPAGTEFTLRQYAEKMISISDNTAADHLLRHVGRTSVETAMAYMGHANPRLNSPFLTTRELFALKLAADDSTLKEFIQADGLGRVGLLPAIDALTPTLASATAWKTPRYINQLEWFASCNDLANALPWLHNKGSSRNLAPVLDILKVNPGVALDDKTWPYVGYKGGSEPGVLTTSWLLRSASNRTFVVSGALNDTKSTIDEASAITSITKAINLLGRSL